MRAALVALSFLISACATTHGRFAIGAAIGGGVGAAGGSTLSPNDESRALNAALFGLAGALVGGAFGILTEKDHAPSLTEKTLRSKELGSTSQRNEFEVANPKALPSFVKERLTPVIVEEYKEPDSISEDGALHEPHKVYRIRRPAELISKPEATIGDAP